MNQTGYVSNLVMSQNLGKMSQEVWKLFYPQSSWSLPSGLLIGVVNYEQSSVTVTTVVNQEISLKQPLQGIHDLNAHLYKISNGPSDHENSSTKRKLKVVGLLVKEDEDIACHTEVIKSLVWEDELFLLVQKTRNSVLPECVIFKIFRCNTWSTVQNLMLIAFDSSVEYRAKVLHSVETPMSRSCTQNGKVVDHTIDSLSNWNSMKSVFDFRRFGQIESKNNGFFQGSCHSVVLLLLGIVTFLMNIYARMLNTVFSSKIFKYWIFDAVLHLPATGCQLKEKYNQLQEFIILDSARDYNRKMNLLLMLVFDFAVGLILILILHQTDFSNILATAFMQFANTTANSLEQLLRWLMGAPAGLKLNRELASFLGHFFLYHIYLWVGYLGAIAPFLAIAIRFTSLCGCLGLSVVIALSSDVLSILTFHIYCFYVYAARIYCLQVHGLMAFWHLFRGKKWNVLRQRVDSCAFHVDQLFLGTLLFTILLFLLPTTALFYTVFTLLRLAVLIPQSFVAKMITVMNRIPFYSLLLWTVRAGFMVEGISFHPLPTERHQQHSWLLLKMKPMSLMKVMTVASLSDNITNDKSTWRTLGRDLLSGYLVYPWGGKQEE
ncbi:phosphatidylinositol N-acetylglucosaminyltransferase subunit Q-like isoform X2 [Anneissia japonica]|uniref:phosphatidylinositol N-acetylglucosaminyltransferase subunit Q-like isoform X2 n=2 Tax=Anneissia japonica TaxID=1529436 RepID=UPI0014256945|nr:phosphatidylinositol N-acetylglucosaminyltransferase subunit Q-like isoform X2 [Anneissia japonica]